MGKWVKSDLWLPDEISLDMWHMEHHPHVIIAPHRAHGLVRAEVFAEDPDQVVMLITPGTPLYGSRISSFVVHDSVTPEDKVDPDRWIAYMQTVECRVAPPPLDELEGE